MGHCWRLDRVACPGRARRHRGRYRKFIHGGRDKPRPLAKGERITRASHRLARPLSQAPLEPGYLSFRNAGAPNIRGRPNTRVTSRHLNPSNSTGQSVCGVPNCALIKHFGQRGPSRSRHGCATLTAKSAVHRWLGFLPLVRDAANASAAPRHVEVIGEAPHVLSCGGCDSDRDHGVRPRTAVPPRPEGRCHDGWVVTHSTAAALVPEQLSRNWWWKSLSGNELKVE